MAKKKETKVVDAELVENGDVVFETEPEEIVIEDLLGKQIVKVGDKKIIRVNGEDIVTYGPNNEIISCSLNRVDMDDPASILDYGSEYVTEISSLLKKVSEAAIEDESSVMSDDLIDSVKSFEDNMETTRKRREKEEKLPAIIKKGKSLLAQMGVEKFKKEAYENTDEACYKSYCNRIVELSNGVMQQAEACNKDMQLRGATVRDIMPPIHKLHIAHEIGEMDLAAYEAETARMENGTYSMDISFEIERRKVNADQFRTVLADLQSDKILYQEQVSGYAVQQRTDMSIIRTSARWIRVIAPVLEANANLGLFNFRQAKRLMAMAKLDKAGNEAIAESGDNIRKNAELAVELEVNGGIKLETLQGLHNALLDGNKIYEGAQDQLRARIEKEKAFLRQISDEQDDLQRGLSHGTEDVALLLGEGNNGKPLVKALGTRSDSYKRGRKN